MKVTDGSQGKILLVDDNKNNIVAIESALNGIEVEIVSVLSGKEALRRLMKERFVLVLLDVAMPDMSGFEVAELMRSSAAIAHVPIIFISAAYTDRMSMFKGYNLGAIDYLLKPLDEVILCSKVNCFLEMWQVSEKYKQAKELLEVKTVELEETFEKVLQAKEYAEHADAAKSAFLAKVSHEVRTPLSAIIGLTQLVTETELTEQQHDYLRKVQISAESLLSIINDLLDLSKIESGQMSVESIEFKIETVLKQLVDTFSFKCVEKGLELVVDVDKDVPAVLLGDPMRLGQVLKNLVSNAVKFTEKGSVLVKVEKIINELLKDECFIKISVADTGIGMTKEDIVKLFQPFVQASTSIARKYGGTGLGLAICKNLVEMMDGEILVSSAIGQGTDICFTVKCRYSNGADVEQVQESSKVLQSREEQQKILNAKGNILLGLKIMVVEDNLLNQHIAAEFLRKYGAQPMVANNGQEAIDNILRQKCDIILMDVQMPIMNGLEACRAIREMPGCEKIPIIAMTAAAMESDIRQCYEAGMNDHTVKPIKATEMVEKVLRWAGREANNLSKIERDV